MKILSAVLFFSIAFAACGKIEQFGNLTQQKIETESSDAEQPDAPPILEITQDASGAFRVTGKTLLFNLYDNGVIEFEYADEKNLAFGKEHKAEDVNVLKRAKIGTEELQKFIDLLKTEEFKTTKDEYKRKCCCMDTNVDYKISFTDSLKQKNITLSDYCDLYELRSPKIRQTGEFPQVLSNLMILVDNSRQKYTSQ